MFFFEPNVGSMGGNLLLFLLFLSSHTHTYKRFWWTKLFMTLFFHFLYICKLSIFVCMYVCVRGHGWKKRNENEAKITTESSSSHKRFRFFFFCLSIHLIRIHFFSWENFLEILIVFWLCIHGRKVGWNCQN